MIRRYRFSVVGCSVFMLLGIAGCGSEPSASGAPSHTPGRPPPPPPRKPSVGPGLVLAIDKLFLGETDRDDVLNQIEGWMQYGFNLDGKASTDRSTDLCQPVGLSTPGKGRRDGHDGIDNAFGNTLLNLIRPFSGRPSAEVNQAIFNGESTLIIRIEELGDDSSYNPLTATIHSGAALTSPPKWDGTDVWPILPEQIEDPAETTGRKGVFREGYLVDNVWVSGPGGAVDLKLKISGEYLNLPLRHAIIMAQLDDEHLNATNGTIAGVIETEELVKEARDFAVRLNDGFCSGDTVSAMLDQIRAASDIMKDGTQDPSRPCDAISIGVGFTAKPAQLGAVVPGVEPLEDPCP